LEELQTVWNRHANRFDKTDDNLGRVVEKIMEIVNWNSAKLNEQVQSMDSALAETVSLLAGNIEELNETAQEFHETTQAFSEATKSWERMGSRQNTYHR
jgi:ABC-type transporter Mla subunit MlaD